jgi:hypothetical protein
MSRSARIPPHPPTDSSLARQSEAERLPRSMQPGARRTPPLHPWLLPCHAGLNIDPRSRGASSASAPQSEACVGKSRGDRPDRGLDFRNLLPLEPRVNESARALALSHAFVWRAPSAPSPRHTRKPPAPLTSNCNLSRHRVPPPLLTPARSATHTSVKNGMVASPLARPWLLGGWARDGGQLKPLSAGGFLFGFGGGIIGDIRTSMTAAVRPSVQCPTLPSAVSSSLLPLISHVPYVLNAQAERGRNMETHGWRHRRLVIHVAKWEKEHTLRPLHFIAVGPNHRTSRTVSQCALHRGEGGPRMRDFWQATVKSAPALSPCPPFVELMTAKLCSFRINH